MLTAIQNIDSVSNEEHQGGAPGAALRPLLHSREEASRILSVSLSTLKLLIGRGALREVRLGKRRLIARSEIERLVSEQLPALGEDKK